MNSCSWSSIGTEAKRWKSNCRGVMDPEDASPIETAIRELREETGYEGESARVIGEMYSNPAIMSNKTSTVLIENCELRHDVDLDDGEDVITKVVPYDEIEHMIVNGAFRHSLVVAALFYHELDRKRDLGQITR